MDRSQHGFVPVVALLIIAVAVVFGIGASVYVATKQPVYVQQQAQESSVAVTTLSKADILSASYPIKANFGGKITSVHVVTFPPTPSSFSPRGNVWITESGKISYADVLPSAENGGVEGFWISDYKFSDTSYTKAYVWIEGSWGASASEEKVFTVQKMNGEVIVMEGKTTDVSRGPSVTSISPSITTVGSSVTINGSGFAYQRPSDQAGMGLAYRTGVLAVFQNNQGQKINVFRIERGSNLNDNQVSFVVPTQGEDNSKSEIGTDNPIPITPGTYLVSIWTALGWSNSVALTITSVTY